MNESNGFKMFLIKNKSTNIDGSISTSAFRLKLLNCSVIKIKIIAQH